MTFMNSCSLHSLLRLQIRLAAYIFWRPIILLTRRVTDCLERTSLLSKPVFRCVAAAFQLKRCCYKIYRLCVRNHRLCQSQLYKTTLWLSERVQPYVAEACYGWLLPCRLPCSSLLLAEVCLQTTTGLVYSFVWSVPFCRGSTWTMPLFSTYAYWLWPATERSYAVV